MYITRWKTCGAMLTVAALLSAGLPAFASTSNDGESLSAITVVFSMIWGQLGLTPSPEEPSADTTLASPEDGTGTPFRLGCFHEVTGSHDLGACIDPDG